MGELLDDKIKALREKLNKLMEDNSDYSQIYSVSLELDKLILEYSTAEHLLKL